MKDQMMLFGVTLAKRYTKSQKRIFYSQTVPYFEKMGYSVEYQESAGKLNQTTNLIIGNLEKAKNVILCPYDTPASTLLPYKYFPFNWKQNLNQEYLGLGISFLIYAAIAGLLFYFINYVSGISSLFQTIGIILLVIVVFFGFSVVSGLANPINFNKNSASVALAASLAQKLPRNSNTCFVLLDRNSTSSAGLKLLAQKEDLKNKLFIYLDCLAFGEKLAFLHNPDAAAEAKTLEEHLSNLPILDKEIGDERGKDTYIQFFPKMIHICVGSIERQKFVVRYTRSKKDYQVDLPRLEQIHEGLLTYLKG